MELESNQIEALEAGEKRLFHRDFCPYLELKGLLASSDAFSRDRFRDLFTEYYQLRIGGLTDQFADRYFKILFHPPRIGSRLDLRAIFEELCGIKNRRGLLTLPFSFFSKLVAMHDESSPIYDRHVSNFFHLKPPSSSTEMSDRIEWCIRFLESVREDYSNWAMRPDISKILTRLKERDNRLAECHNVRLIDILVWKVGNKKLLSR